MTWAGLIIPGSLLLLGFVLLLVGLRGRRRGDHLHCRQCAFDLTGLRDETLTCPECGSSITSPHNRMRGVRVKSRGLIIAGIVLLLISGVLGAQRMTAFNYYRYAPNLVLVRLLNAEAARKETAARITDGKLTGLAATQAVNRALAVQGDRKIPWHDTWGAIIEEAGAKGLVSAAQTQRYAEQAVELTLGIRPKVQIGRQPSCRVHDMAGPSRLGPNTQITIVVRATRFSINSQDIELTNTHKTRLSRLNRGFGASSTSSTGLPVRETLTQLGQYDLELTVQPVYTVAAGIWTSNAINGTPLTLTATTQVVDHPTGTYVTPSPSELAEWEENARLWIYVHTQTNQRSLIFSAQLSQRFNNPALWIGVDGDWIDVSSWVHTSGATSMTTRHHLQYQFIDMNKIHKQFPTATHVDLLARPKVSSAETTMPSPYDIPWSLGEWRFNRIPLDATPQTHDPSRGIDMPSLAPAQARALTLEEAEKPPQ